MREIQREFESVCARERENQRERERESVVVSVKEGERVRECV